MTKKIISLLLAAIFAVGMMTVAFADGEEEPDDTFQILAQFYGSNGSNATTALQKDSTGGNTAIGLKPADATNAEGAWFEYLIEIPADLDTLVIRVKYAASGDRHMDVSLDEEVQNVTCPDTTSWELFSTLDVTFEKVTAGSHTLHFAAPSDFNNDTIKTPNIESFELRYYLAAGQTLPVETEKQTDAPTDAATEAPKDDGTNAPTGDNKPAGTGSATDKADGGEGGCGSALGVSAVVIAAAAVFGCAIVRRRGE